MAPQAALRTAQACHTGAINVEAKSRPTTKKGTKNTAMNAEAFQTMMKHIRPM
jgi:hypothetical protein